jgi:hypothetical protein
MAAKPRARVTAVYDIAAKAAPALEELLRSELPRHISCTVLEVSHAEQVPLEDEVDRGREQQGLGVEPVGGDAGQDGGVAGAPGQDAVEEQERGSTDDGDGGQAVLREEDGDLNDVLAIAGETADSGAREGTGGYKSIVPSERE